MGRPDGFSNADIAVGHLDDDRVRKLWRILGPDQAAMAEAITTHLAVVLASWGSGRRKPLDEALPIWLSPSATVLEALVAVGLLDRQHRVPVRSWSRHYGPAEARRNARTEAGRAAGIASGIKRSERPFNGRERLPNPAGRQAGRTVPSESVPPTRGGAAARGGPPRSPREIMQAEGGFAAGLAREENER